MHSHSGGLWHSRAVGTGTAVAHNTVTTRKHGAPKQHMDRTVKMSTWITRSGGSGSMHTPCSNGIMLMTDTDEGPIKLFYSFNIDHQVYAKTVLF